MEAHHRVNGPNTGRNFGGRGFKKEREIIKIRHNTRLKDKKCLHRRILEVMSMNKNKQKR